MLSRLSNLCFSIIYLQSHQKSFISFHRKWSVDLTIKESDPGYSAAQQSPHPLGMKRISAIEKENKQTKKASASAGSEVSTKEKQRAAAIGRKKSNAAMGLATSPGKSLLMNSFMMYMSGSNLNMWSISVTGMAIMNPIKSIVGLRKTFSKFEDPGEKVDLQMPKLIFVLLNLAMLAVGLYKMSKMRLLPTTSADWSGRIVWKEMMEVTSIPPL